MHNNARRAKKPFMQAATGKNSANMLRWISRCLCHDSNTFVVISSACYICAPTASLSTAVCDIIIVSIAVLNAALSFFSSSEKIVECMSASKFYKIENNSHRQMPVFSFLFFQSLPFDICHCRAQAHTHTRFYGYIFPLFCVSVNDIWMLQQPKEKKVLKHVHIQI